jgi:HAD superfamily hydrolase (TIGR01509 family)
MGAAMLKAVVFDLDETLIDSKDALLLYFRRLYAQVGEAFPEATKEYLYTAPEKGILASLFHDPQKLAAARAFRDAYPDSEHIKPITLKPFAREAIEALHGHYKLAVATNRGPTTDDVLRKLGVRDCFEIVIMARSLARAKPDPLVMNTVMAHLGVTAQETLFVGDSQVDVDTTAGVGCRCVIVGLHAKEGLGDYQLEDLSGLPALVEKLASEVY